MILILRIGSMYIYMIDPKGLDQCQLKVILRSSLSSSATIGSQFHIFPQTTGAKTHTGNLDFSF